MFGPDSMPTGSTISSSAVIRGLRIDKSVLADTATIAPDILTATTRRYLKVFGISQTHLLLCDDLIRDEM